MRKLLLLAVVGLAGTQSLAAQEIKSPAELMPANALVYGEIRQIGALAQEIRRLVEDSALGNVPDSLLKITSKLKTPSSLFRQQEMAALGLAFAPEIVKELQRVQGAGAALTGIDPQGDPEFVVVILPGQSLVPHFLMRMGLAMVQVRPVDTIEGVKLYRHYYYTAFRKEADEDNPKFSEQGPVFAQMPGLIAIGSKEAVKDVILRAKGKARGPALATEKAFQEASKLIDAKPGLFAYASCQNLGKVLQGKANVGPLELGIRSMLSMLQAWSNVAYAWSLDQGTLHIRLAGLLDPKNQNLLAELLPSRPVNLKIFHLAPRDTVLAIGLANPDGEKRLAKILEFLDQAVGPFGAKKPSEYLRDLEGQLGINLGKEIVGPVTDVALVMGDPLKAPIRRIEEKGPNFHMIQESPEVPLVFLVQATDDKAAQKLLQLVPRIYALVSQDRMEPEIETIAGQELRKLKGRGSDNLYYGRQGRILVLGPHAQPVAAALTAGSKQQGLLTDAKTASRLRELEEPWLVYLVKPVSLVVGALGAGSHAQSTFQSVEAKIGGPAKKIDDVPKKIKIKKVEEKKIEKQAFPAREKRIETIEIGRNPEHEKLLKELSQLLNAEEWLVLGVTHKKDRLLLVEGKAPGLDKTIPRLIDFAVEQSFRAGARFQVRPPRPIPGGAGAGGVGGGQVILSLQGNLAQNDPQDRVQRGPHKVHVIKMEAGKTYTIDLQSKDFDAYLRLENAAGLQLAQDDDGGEGLNARLVFRPTGNDNFRIIATSFDRDSGNYTLTVRER